MSIISRFILKLLGWKIIGDFPDKRQFMLIVAPHTSNWDLIIGLMARFAKKTKINFLAKSQLFFFPLGSLLQALGGMPVDRSKKSNKVQQVVELYRSQDNLKLAITPEGTRGAVSRWKEGFYHIACEASICIVMVGFDYTDKEIRLSEPFWPTGDIDKDFPQFIAYFRTIKGRYPKVIPDYVARE